MILRRIARYGIGFVAIILILSIFSIVKNWDVLTTYFTNLAYSFAGIGLYLLIFGVAFWIMLKPLFR